MTITSGPISPAIIMKPANPLEQSMPPVAPLEPRSALLQKGTTQREGAYPLPCDIAVDYDAAIPVRTGATLYADIFRPVGTEPVPAIVVYTPYAKRGGWWNANFYVTNFGVAPDAVSGLQSFESPDPGYWCDHGYAIVMVDAAGTSHSEGDENFMGSASGRNAYDAIEWVASQPWCSGRVGMAGNSQLAMIQWAAAAEQPPHLAAIAPWEGLIDTYREVTLRGGIPDHKFHDADIAAFIYGRSQTEDLTPMAERYPLMNGYWEDKRPHLDRISIPTYVVASWTSPLHPHGTLEAFRAIASEDKWLRVHNTQEWLDFADKDNIQDLRAFFDRYLKGLENEWEQTPRVRLSVLDPGGVDVVGRVEQEWPLERQRWQTFFLDAASRALTPDAPTTSSVAEYEGTDLTASVRFSTVVDQDTEITGHLNLRLWVEAADAEDMDLFAAVYKEDAEGRRLHHITLSAPPARAHVQSLERDGRLPATLAYTGPVGRLRVSHRATDPERSTPSEPWLTHEQEQLLTPGEVVAVDLSLWPTSMLVKAGERLVVELAGHPVGPLEAQGLPGGWLEIPTRNRGKHRIHTGGDRSSRLLLPVIPS